jgi:carbonic anhydrase
MKNLFLVIIAIFLLQTIAPAQTAQLKHETKDGNTIAVHDAKWRAAHYIVDRDSAAADPRLAIKKLIGGNKRFVENKSIQPRQDAKTITKLSSGQQPFTTIVGCSDSRVPIELVFDQGFGDLFIIRTAGQVLAFPSYGSIEYGVLKLKTKLIVVLGHTDCGAVAAAIHGPGQLPPNIVSLIAEIKPAIDKTLHLPGNQVTNAAKQNVIDQVNTLRNSEPVLHKKYMDGDILIVGALYDTHNGKVEFLKETMLNFPAKH